MMTEWSSAKDMIEPLSPSLLVTARYFLNFKKTDLSRVFQLLHFPDICKFENRSERGLYELVNGETKHNISRNVFGRDWSAQSRAFKYFINHIYGNYKHLVMDNLHWWYRNGF
jgi:hypothetical protein